MRQQIESDTNRKRNSFFFLIEVVRLKETEKLMFRSLLLVSLAILSEQHVTLSICHKQSEAERLNKIALGANWKKKEAPNWLRLLPQQEGLVFIQSARVLLLEQLSYSFSFCSRHLFQASFYLIASKLIIHQRIGVCVKKVYLFTRLIFSARGRLAALTRGEDKWERRSRSL